MLSVEITLLSVVITLAVASGGKMKPYELIDAATGELTPAVILVRKSWKGERFFVGFQEAFAYIAKEKIGSEAKDVFLFLLSRLDFENYIFVPQVEVAKELDMQRANVSRAISVLVERGILLEGPKVSRSRTFRLNHTYGWKGKLSNLKVLRNKEQREMTKLPTATETPTAS
jgi:predicted transcriptional regulator